MHEAIISTPKKMRVETSTTVFNVPSPHATPPTVFNVPPPLATLSAVSFLKTKDFCCGEMDVESVCLRFFQKPKILNSPPKIF
jgi:hypothetical protein